MSVTGRNAVVASPAFTATKRRSPGATSARRLESYAFKPNETKDLVFPFLNEGEDRTLRITITGFRLIAPKPGVGVAGEQYGAHFAFTWPDGVTGTNPRSPLVFVKPGGITIGNRFPEPLNVCNSTSIDGAVLKVAVTKDSGNATASGVLLEVEVEEEWAVGEAQTLAPTAGGHAVGVARPRMKIVGSNGGTATLPPLKEKGGAR